MSPLPPLSLSLFQPEYKVADPICTFMFSVFVLCTTVTILRDVFRILMEGIPLAAPSHYRVDRYKDAQAQRFSSEMFGNTASQRCCRLLCDGCNWKDHLQPQPSYVLLRLNQVNPCRHRVWLARCQTGQIVPFATRRFSPRNRKS